MKTYFKTLWTDPGAARKFFVALAGVIMQVILVVFAGASWLPVAIAVATALGVYALPNIGRAGAVSGERSRESQ